MKSTFDLKSPYIIPKSKKRIDASGFKLREWLKLLLDDRDSVWPNNHFPNEQAREEYLKRIKGISEIEVKDLLRNFLPRTGYSQLDIINFKSIMSRSLEKKQFDRIINSNEYLRKIYRERKDVWEGLLWTLDLLPHQPKQAIQTLESYVTANASFISDNLIWSISDCIEIITAKYYNWEHPRDILLEIKPIEFEWLIEDLYKKLGYKTQTTAITNDRGVDIIASKKNVGKREKILIQCKRHHNTVGSPSVRDLLGAVASAKATKGVLVSVSEFSKEARKFSDENPNIELIGYKDLNFLLNKNLGLRWPTLMRYIFKEKRKQT